MRLTVLACLFLVGCAAPYQSERDVIARACEVVADKFDNRCAKNIMVRYQPFSGRYDAYTVGSNGIVMDARCQNADWSRASNCVHMLAHEVAHTAGLKSEHHAEFIANRVWMLR